MSLFGTKDIEPQEEGGSGISKYVSYGIRKVRINYFEIRTASTGSQQVVLNVETPTIDDGEFIPDENSMIGGQIGRVEFTIYMNPSSPSFNDIVTSFNTDIDILSTKLGIQDKVKSIEADNLEDYVEQLNDVMGESNFFYLAITAREYINAEGEKRFTLGKRRWGFAASIEEGEKKLRPFDKNDQYDYKPVEAIPSKEKELEETKEDDFPF